MSWIGWAVICVLGANVLFFGALWVAYMIDKRRDVR